jgi:hypothetical protein
MSTNGRALAVISVDEWDAHVRLEGRILGDNGRLGNAVTALTNETARLATICEKLERGMRKTDRRMDSYEDLDKEARMAELMAQVKHYRSMPTRVIKWTGWLLGLAVAGIEIWKALH